MSWTAGRRETGDGVPVTASSADPQVAGSNDPLALNYNSSTIEALNRNLGEARSLHPDLGLIPHAYQNVHQDRAQVLPYYLPP